MINLLDNPGHELIGASGESFDRTRFFDGSATALLFSAAMSNFGVRHLLDLLLELAPAARLDVRGQANELDAPFSAFVFKVQTGTGPMPTAIRSRSRACVPADSTAA